MARDSSGIRNVDFVNKLYTVGVVFEAPPNQPVDQPANQPASQPASQPANNPASHPTSQPSKSASLQTSQQPRALMALHEPPGRPRASRASQGHQANSKNLQAPPRNDRNHYDIFANRPFSLTATRPAMGLGGKREAFTITNGHLHENCRMSK